MVKIENQKGAITIDPEVFANLAGDAATGPSLVVRCIDSGRKAAVQIDSFLKKQH